jgi:excisionase family DNA binding protein
MSARKPYPSDLTEIQWQNIHHLFPGGDRRPRSPGRPRTYDRKDIVDAIFYLARTGCQWRALPHDFGSYEVWTMRDGDTQRLTSKQAAERAGVSASLIYTLCHERRLPHYRIGTDGKRGRILIDAADLDAFVEACRKDRHPFLPNAG